MVTPFENELEKRFGVLPNFFRLSATDPKIAANLWRFASIRIPGQSPAVSVQGASLRVPVSLFARSVVASPDTLVSSTRSGSHHQ